MGPGARRATGQHKNVVILVSSHGGMKTDIEEHQPACENITNIDVDLIWQPEAPNWPKKFPFSETDRPWRGGGVPPFSVNFFPLTFRKILVRGGPGGGGYPPNGKFPCLGFLTPSLTWRWNGRAIAVIFFCVLQIRILVNPNWVTNLTKYSVLQMYRGLHWKMSFLALNWDETSSISQLLSSQKNAAGCSNCKKKRWNHEAVFPHLVLHL